MEAIIEYGILSQERCLFITLTYQADSEGLRDADSVQKDWRQLLRLLKKSKPSWSQMSWMKVVEATKRGIPHHHIVLGGIPKNERLDCGRPGYLDCVVGCVRHGFAAEWFKVTRDSFIVHVKLVQGARKGASYMGKYLTKTLQGGDALEELGFKRRFSRSANWPTVGSMKLVGTDENVWESKTWTWRRNGGELAEKMVKDSTGDRLLEHTGDSVVLEVAKKRRERKMANKLKGVLDASVRSENESGGGGNQYR